MLTLSYINPSTFSPENMVFLLALSNESYSFLDISPSLLLGGRFDVFFASQCYILFVHLPSYKNSYPYNFYPHPSLFPINFMVPSTSLIIDTGPTSTSIMKVTLISMLMSHRVFNRISPYGVHLYSFPLL